MTDKIEELYFFYRNITYNFDLDSVQDYFSELGKLVAAEYVTFDKDFVQIQQHLAALNYTTERLMYELMQPCEHMIANCTWLGRATPCVQLFRVAKSSEGFCCSFNYKAPRNILEVYVAILDNGGLDNTRHVTADERSWFLELS